MNKPDILFLKKKAFHGTKAHVKLQMKLLHMGKSNIQIQFPCKDILILSWLKLINIKYAPKKAFCYLLLHPLLHFHEVSRSHTDVAYPSQTTQTTKSEWWCTHIWCWGSAGTCRLKGRNSITNTVIDTCTYSPIQTKSSVVLFQIHVRDQSFFLSRFKKI
jgi:hypothetical protein